jgi:3-dehydroquinate synthase II
LAKTVWIDTSRAPDSEARKRLILAALESGFGHIVVSKIDKQSNRYGKFHMIIAEGDRFILDKKEIAKVVVIRGKLDEKKAVEIANRADTVVIETSDWRVIPLENLIVQFAKTESRLFVRAESVEDAKLFLETMEKGADGVVFSPAAPEDIARIAKIIEKSQCDVQLVNGLVTKVMRLGLGDRVCVDTCSLLNHGEGLLVGNSAAGMFLINAETQESEYVASRPFRVNAGAVHGYTLLPDGTTKYLGELQAGDEVMVVDSEGCAKTAVVGRIKIERRPLLLIEAKVEGKFYTTMVQNAETIRLVSGSKSISVAELQVGDRVTLRLETGGRHFGSPVKETIREK